MSELLEKIEYAEEDSDRLVKQSVQENKPTERHQINESNNRLYQSKANVLKLFCQQIKDEDIQDSHQAALEDIRNVNKQLTSYQDHLDQIAKEEEKQRKEMATKRITKPVEKSFVQSSAKKVKMTVEVEEAVKKNHYIPLSALFIILMMSIPWMEDVMKTYLIRDDIQLLITPDQVKRNDQSSLAITIAKSAWDKLNDDAREALLDQVEVYLTRKNLHQAKILDGDRLIAAVYASADQEYPGFLRNVFLEADVESETLKTPVVEMPMDDVTPVQRKAEPAAKVAPKKSKAVSKKPAKLKASTKATRNKKKK
jgi:hypothetical protein